MIDVHEPHEAVHTWKDFFIHIITICVGLLIAIGLEQTVEFFHHHHELSDTREALRQEREENRKLYMWCLKRLLTSRPDRLMGGF